MLSEGIEGIVRVSKSEGEAEEADPTNDLCVYKEDWSITREIEPCLSTSHTLYAPHSRRTAANIAYSRDLMQARGGE